MPGTSKEAFVTLLFLIPDGLGETRRTQRQMPLRSDPALMGGGICLSVLDAYPSLRDRFRNHTMTR